MQWRLQKPRETKSAKHKVIHIISVGCTHIHPVLCHFLFGDAGYAPNGTNEGSTIGGRMPFALMALIHCLVEPHLCQESFAIVPIFWYNSLQFATRITFVRTSLCR